MPDVFPGVDNNMSVALKVVLTVTIIPTAATVMKVEAQSLSGVIWQKSGRIEKEW